MRCDANVSVREPGESGFRTKTELKNMNSFRFVERGIEAEIERQTRALALGREVVQETLHFDPVTRLADVAALEGGGARLPLLPRAGPRAAGSDRGDARPRAGRAARAAGRPPRALRGRLRPRRRDGRRPRDLGGARQLLRGGACVRRTAAVRARERWRGWVTGELVAPPARGGPRRPAPARSSRRGARRARRDGRAQVRSRSPPPRRCSRS